MALYTHSGVANDGTLLGNPTERMRIDSSGNVGIGTTSPSSYKDDKALTVVGTSNGAIVVASSAGSPALFFRDSDSPSTEKGYVQYDLTDNWLRFASNGSERMRIDSSGNVGIGRNAGSGIRLDISQSGNCYAYIRDSSDLDRGMYISSGTAATGISIVGTNTANRALGFATNDTERMRITSGGDVGIGTTSPRAILDLNTVRSQKIRFGTAGSIGETQLSAGDYIANNLIVTAESGITMTYTKTTDDSGNAIIQDFTRGITFYTGVTGALNATGTLNTFERMRITSSGNVGIGTTSPGVALDVNGGIRSRSGIFNLHDGTSQGGGLYFYKSISGSGSDLSPTLFSETGLGIFFCVNGSATKAFTMTSGNEFLVGKTTTADTTVGSVMQGTGRLAGAMAASTNAAADTLTVYSTGAGAYRFYVGLGGTVYATSTTISAISDQRYKENIRDLDVGLDAVMALKPRKFDWKEGKGQNTKDCRGFIAQEFEQVFPDLIDKWKDPAPEGEEPYKSVRQDLIPVLVKAIQELKAELDTVKAELSAIKGN
jgi:hypothetical protein